MNFHILSLFPEMFSGFLNDSILKKAQEKGVISITSANIRDFSKNKHKKVDDVLYGGGSGMLLRPEPLSEALYDAKERFPNAHVIYLSPSGQVFTQKKAEELAALGKDLVLVCGRYEGIDQRIRATLIDEEISIGEYVLSGGEIASAVLIDAVARLIPEVVGKAASLESESFSESTFRCAEFPHFTRPKKWNGLEVPEVLLSGDHKKIEEWRLSHLIGLSDPERKMLSVRLHAFPRKTKHLLFRLHEESDIEHWMKWVNDEEVIKYIPLSPPLTYEDELDFFQSSREDLSVLPLSVCDRKTKKPLGTTSLIVDHKHSFSATFGIMIGDKTYWGKGLCQEILTEILTVAFDKLGLEKVTLKVFSENAIAQKCYEKCGFHKIGLSRKALQKNGVFFDEFLYDIVKDDFIQKKLKR